MDFSLEADFARPHDILRRTYSLLTHVSWLHLKLGMEKTPIGLDELNSTAEIPFVDRSEVSDRFSTAEDIGVHLESRWPRWLLQSPPAMVRHARFEETNEVFLCPLFWTLFKRSSLITHGPTYDIAIRSQNYLVS